MSFSISIDLGKMNCWPLRGFAPGGYFHERCASCQKAFNGDKRATQCLECAINGVKATVSKLDDDLRGMGAELLKADARAADPDERIVAVAVYHGGTISLPPPARHGQVLQAMELSMGIDVSKITTLQPGLFDQQGSVCWARGGEADRAQSQADHPSQRRSRGLSTALLRRPLVVLQDSIFIDSKIQGRFWPCFHMVSR